MSQKNIELSLVFPAYNEGKAIAFNVKKTADKLEEWGINYEMIIVNDGSVDDTVDQVKPLLNNQISLLSYAQNRGKGYAVNYGMKHVVGKYRLFMDVDLATSLDEIPKVLTTIKHHQFDVIIGNRKIDPSMQVVKQPLYRRIFGAGFTWLSSIFVGRKFTDFTCGFKLFKAEAAEAIFMRQRIFNWAFDTEIMFIAMRHKLVIHETPVVWYDQRNSKVRLLRDIATSMAGLIQIRLNNLKGLYR
jgi:dolichyl-phosphate beta-glucosyltransferase